MEKIDEVPEIEVTHHEINSLVLVFKSNAIICRFNGFWPKAEDLHNWIHSTWIDNCDYYLCAKGFFIVHFISQEDYQTVFNDGPWFWGRAGLFINPWFPEFDPNIMVVTKMPVWVRLPNLPLQFCHNAVLTDIGNNLGKFIKPDHSRFGQSLFSYTRICIEADLSKGLPDKIILKHGIQKYIQTLDYENTAFRCRICHQTGHLQESCPQDKKAQKKTKEQPAKPKHWRIHETIYDEEEDQEEQENTKQKKKSEKQELLEEEHT